MPGQTAKAWATRTASGGLMLLLFLLPLPFGAHRPVPEALLGVWIGALAIIGFAAAARRPLPTLARQSMLLWGLWLSWTLVQLLPLPPELLGRISPRAYAIHDAVAQAGFVPQWCLSVAPAETVDALILGVSYFLLYFVVVHYMDTRHSRQLLLVVVASALIQALWGSLMTLSGLEYGFLEPKHTGIGVATGTFINRNHFAAYLNIGLAAGTGLVLSELRAWRRSDWRGWMRLIVDLAFSGKFRVRIALAVMVIALVLSRSRGGNLAFFAALTVCGGIFLLYRHRRWLGRGLIFFLSILVVDLWIVSQWFGLDELQQRLERTDVSAQQRVIVLEALPPLITDYLWTGTGLASFDSIFPAYAPLHLSGRFDHAHNDYAELLIETGLPGALLVIALVLLHLRHSARVLAKRRKPEHLATAFALLMSGVAVGLHAWLDFPLHIPAVTATLVALAGAVAAIAPDSSRRRRQPDDSSRVDLGVS